MEDLESMGLLKMDFLGLRNLTNWETVDLIKQTHGSNSIGSTALMKEKQKILAKGSKENASRGWKAYKILEGELEGIFQLESNRMRQMCATWRKQ